MGLSQKLARPADIAKLHSESLQLRNQQFLLGTLALTVSGIAVWIPPSVIEAGSQREDAVSWPTVLASTIAWLVMLAVLYCWSLRLRVLMVVISEYLKLHQLSEWEQVYFDFHEKHRDLIPSQTVSVVRVFRLYGAIVVFGGLFATFSARMQTNASLVISGIVLASGLAAFQIAVQVIYLDHKKTCKMIENLCRLEFNRSE